LKAGASDTSETNRTRAVRDTARGSKNRTTPEAAGPIRQLFADARRALMRPAPAPPKKRKRSGDDEARAADLRKQIKRLFRKVRRHVGDDCRDAPPTVDSDWWHWHRQSMADPGGDHRHQPGGRNPGPHCPSPTL
jgi:hypothetical protein